MNMHFLGGFLLRLRPAILASWIKALIGWKRIEARTAEGIFWIDSASSLGHDIYSNGTYESYLVAILKDRLRQGQVFVDLGANEGYLTVVGAACVGASGRVVAIEPQFRLKQVLERNLQLNHVENVVIEQVAVSDHAGKVDMYLSADTNTGSAGLSQSTKYPQRCQSVPMVTLHEVFERNGISECTLLKVDIEGWEYEAVLGSPELFRAGVVKQVVLEMHPVILKKKGMSGDDIIEFLKGSGYRHEAVPGHLLFVHSSWL